MTPRRLFLGAAIAAPASPAFFAPAFGQAAWPQRSVRFVVGFAPGGFTDVIARLLAEHLGEAWGQSVIVENRGGAGGNVAAQQMARATPDGYTALVTSGAFAINVSLSRNPGYRPDQFVPAAVVAGTPNLFVVRADSPIRSLRDMVETARRRPLTYGTAGVGVAAHLSAELLFRRAGAADATHVPYSGAGPAMLALLAGTIDVVATSLPSAVPQIQGGQARGIGVTSERRNQALPDVPTIAEAGFEPIVDVAWVAVFYPTGTPQPVLERVNADVQRAMARPAFQQRLAAMGFDLIGGDLARAQAYVASEIALWRDIVRTVNVQID